MKKLSMFLALAMLLTVGGVYAVWTYTNSTDVMDINTTSVIDMTAATAIGTYGTYEFDNQLVMTVDPKEGTTHTTALYITGTLTIKFTPNTYAPAEIKANGVQSFFSHDLTNTAWTYDSREIMTVDDSVHTIGTVGSGEAMTWTKQADGSFAITLTAEQIADEITLTEFVLDTKVKYDAFDAVLGQGQIRFHISDGITTPPATT